MTAIHTPIGHTETVGSERSFGLVFAGVFGAIAAWPLLNEGSVRGWALAVASAFLVLAFARPALLRPLNLLWFRFGLFLSKLSTPVVMGALFLLVVLPTGIIIRLRGRELLGRIDKHRRSYWIERAPPGPQPKTMQNQY